jgi:hypothetical protein
LEDFLYFASGSLFFAACVAVIASGFLAVIESIGVWRFNGLVFRTGLAVLNDQRILPNPNGRFPGGETVDTANGKFLFVTPAECFFRHKSRLFSLQIHTPFPLKGTISWSGDQVRIRGRAPLSSFLIFGTWLVGWVAGSLTMIVSGREGAEAGISLLVIGVAVVGGMVAVSLPIEKRRLRKLVRELESLVASPDA